MTRSLRALATQIRAQPSSRSLSSSAYGDASPWSTLPSSTMALQVPQVPWVQAWGSQMPSRRHASSTVWSSRQVISVPSGSTRTVCLVVAAHLLVVCDRWFTGPWAPAQRLAGEGKQCLVSDAEIGQGLGVGDVERVVEESPVLRSLGVEVGV